LLPGEAKNVTWDKAIDFAGDAGGSLPTRREQSLLFANLKEEFEERRYWSCEQHASYFDYAWTQYFNNGAQYSGHESYGGRARVVRRVLIERRIMSEIKPFGFVYSDFFGDCFRRTQHSRPSGIGEETVVYTQFAIDQATEKLRQRVKELENFNPSDNFTRGVARESARYQPRSNTGTYKRT
jgi:hypothetical protein